MNVASIVGMVGLAVLGLLLGWWLGKREIGGKHSASRQSGLAGRQTTASSAQRTWSRGASNRKARFKVCAKSRPRWKWRKTRSEEQLKAAQQALVKCWRRPEMICPIRLKSLAADILENTNKQFLALATEEFDAKQQAESTRCESQ